MKNIVPFLVGLAIVLGGGWFLISNMEKRADKAEVAAAVAAARMESLRQVNAMVAGPSDKVGYDRQQIVKKNIEAIEAIRKEHPGALGTDAFITEMEHKAAEGTKDKAKTAEYRVRFDYAKELFDNVLKPNVAPVLSGYSAGVRYDLASVKPSMENGQDGLRWDVLIWGAPAKEQIQLQNIEIVSVIHFAEMETSGKRKGQPKRNIMKINLAPAMPYVLLDKPWEWLPEWPAGAMAGYYVGIPKLDSRTDRVSITLTGMVRTIGGTQIPLNMTWKNVKVPAEWKGSPGGKWDDASIAPISDEDMKEQGVEPADIDAPPADEKQK